MAKPAMMTTPQMETVGLDWFGVNGVVQHVIHLLETEGPQAAKVCADILKLVNGVVPFDLTAIISALMAGSVDVQKLIADIRIEFGI